MLIVECDLGLVLVYVLTCLTGTQKFASEVAIKLQLLDTKSISDITRAAVHRISNKQWPVVRRSEDLFPYMTSTGIDRLVAEGHVLNTRHRIM